MANVVAQVSMWVLLLLVTSHLGSDATREVLAVELGTSTESMENHGFSDVSEQSGRLHPEVTSYFRQALPDAVMPESMSKLVSPLPSLAVHQLVDRIESGELDSGKSLGAALCSSGAFLCRDDSELADMQNAMETPTNHITAVHLADSSSLFLETQLLSNKRYEVPAAVFSHSASQKPFLPRPLAKLLERLANQGLDNLLRRLHLKKGSRMAASLRSSLEFCRSMSQAQSVGACASSLEDLADLAAGMLGNRGSGRVALLTASDTGSSSSSSTGQDKFRVVKVDNRFVNAAGTSDYLACHHMTAPFALEFCENAPTTKLYLVTMESMAAKGRTIDALALCHMDTSKWDSSMDVFNTLGTKPGQSGVCQWRKAGSYTFAATNNK